MKSIKQNQLKLGEDYHIVENRIRYDAKYLARMGSLKGVYHCFGRITQQQGTSTYFLPSFNEVRETRSPDAVTIISLKEGSFSVSGRNVIMNPESKPTLAGFEDFGRKISTDANADICRKLIPILAEAKQ